MSGEIPEGVRAEQSPTNERMAQLERHLAAAQQIAHIGSWEWQLATGVVTWSDELYRIYGLAPQSCVITFETFLAKLHPDDRARIQGEVSAALERAGRFAYQERIVRADGEVRALDTVGEVVRDAAGRPLRVIGTCRDVTDERKRAETMRLYASIVENVQIALCVWCVPDPADPRSATLVAFNPAVERVAGAPLSGALGKSLGELFPPIMRTELPEALGRVASEGTLVELSAFRIVSPGNLRQTFSVQAFPLPGGCVGLALEDVTPQANAQKLQAAERRVLELVASGAKLQDVLTKLVLAIEEQAPETIGSIQLLDHDKLCILHGAAPSLPAEYNRAVHGQPIGPSAGSCGAAAFLGRQVLVEDIETDPLWSRYRELALPLGLRACWSTPIFASDGRVLGTFALYYRERRNPGKQELELIARATHLAGIAIERRQLDDQLRALSAYIESVREDERTAVSREIHDELGQALTALKMDVAWIARRTGAAAPLDRDAITQKLRVISQMTDQIIDRVRRISAELRPGVLDDLGLVAAIEWQAQEFERRTDALCVVSSNAHDARFDRKVSTEIFRIFQEALTNVARHAEARRVDVSIEQAHGRLRLEVRDDGKGIAREAIQSTSSLGLLGLRERARRLGGSATVSGRPEGGTLVAAEVPLPAAGAAR